ncbi:MAG: hypothetical protein ACRCWB_11760 [Enterovibrio sp.]
MKDYVRLEKPSAAKIAIKRAYRKAKPHLINFGVMFLLVLVTSIDFFN